MAPETYIVRIYRRNRSRAGPIVGRVETPGGGSGSGFVTLAELSAILRSPKARLRSTDEAPVRKRPRTQASRHNSQKP